MRQNARTDMRTRTGSGTRGTGIAATLAVTAALAACSGDPHARGGGAAVATVAIAPDVKLLPAPSTEPEDLPGVDTSELTPRERHNYWRWVSQLYAPCSELAVSIAQCVKEDRACGTCVPAAKFLAERARSGAPQNEAIAAFGVRFGADVKKIDMADSPSRGPATAPVTIVVWSDFECPACGFAVPYLDSLLEKHPDDVRLVHKLYPLKSHPHSRAAARASIAARRQGKYWEMEKELFAHQKHLEDSDLAGYARGIGLDMARYARDIADPKAEELIERDRAEAEKQGLSGTPFIVINGREFDLAFFRLDRDLEPWIVLEAETQRKEAERRAIAGVAAALSGAGKGPVGPLGVAGSGTAAPVASTGVPPASTGVPAAGSAAPGAAPVATGAPSATAKP